MFTFAGARVNAGLDQKTASTKLGISQQCLSLIEKYKMRPKLITYIRMCEIYKVEPKDFEWRLTEKRIK